MQLQVAIVQVLAVVLLVKEALHQQNVLQAADTAVQTKVDQVATAIATTHVGVELAVATKNQAINSVIIKKLNLLGWG